MYRQKRNGFTIIELVVVIVVIAILASITIVAYNGIQSRAKNTQLLSAMDTYEKVLRQYKVLHKHYPYTSDTPETTAYAVCLGEYPTAYSSIQPGYCWRINWGGETTDNLPVSETLNNELRTIVTSLPSVPNIATVIQNDGLTYTIRGIYYMPAIHGAQTAQLIYYIDGDQKCGRGTKTATETNGVTITACAVSLT